MRRRSASKTTVTAKATTLRLDRSAIPATSHAKQAVFVGCNALGDTLCTTPVVRAFRERHEDVFITYVVQNATYCRVLDANPDIDLVLYNEHLWLHGTAAVTPTWVYSLPLVLREPAILHHFDMTAVCNRAESFQEHIARGFARLLGIPIASARPVVRVTVGERRVASGLVANPYVVFSMHSNANPMRPNGVRAKDWPLVHWVQLARHLRNHGIDVVAVGAESDTRPPADAMRSLYGLPIKIVAALLEAAACVVTLENGLAHLAYAVDARMVELYSPIVPAAWATPVEASTSRVIYKDPQQVTVTDVIQEMNAIMVL
jgi:ADP-heptose:LPS heptosyltransferase